MKLNKFSEAERTLLGKVPKTSREQRQTFEERTSQVPNGAAGFYLLG
jgi:hypothetical protein